MASFKETIERVRALTEQLGYHPSDMKKIAEHMESRQREWVRNFDGYLERMIADRSEMSIQAAVQKAEALADARDEVVERRGQELEKLLIDMRAGAREREQQETAQEF